MNGVLRMSFGSLLVLGLVATGNYLFPQTLASLGLSADGWRELQRQAESNRRLADLLDRDAASAVQRVLSKYQTINELLEGRITLQKAACRFREWNRTVPRAQWPMHLKANEAGSDEECHFREVLGYVRQRAAHHPEHAALARRLEAEVTDGLQQGALRLAE